MHTSIFISCTSARCQPTHTLVYWRKLVLNILALLERKDTYQVNFIQLLCTLFYFINGNSRKKIHRPHCIVLK